jgi:hypothetical protein
MWQDTQRWVRPLVALASGVFPLRIFLADLGFWRLYHIELEKFGIDMERFITKLQYSGYRGIVEWCEDWHRLSAGISCFVMDSQDLQEDFTPAYNRLINSLSKVKKSTVCCLIMR